MPESLGAIQTADLENPTDPDLRRVLERVRAYDRDRDPIPLHGPGGESVLGYLHYGPSRLTTQLVWMPWLEALLIVSFMGAVLMAFRSLKRSEQRSIWVGMAKETAHQMGTPLTSLNGWIALLRDPETRSAPDRIAGGRTRHRLRRDPAGRRSAREGVRALQPDWLPPGPAAGPSR